MADAEAVQQRQAIADQYRDALVVDGVNIADCILYGLLPSLLPSGDPADNGVTH